eukprot:scaffold116994_cov69-Phaeocystis_antarctica.AAC.3
MPRESSRAHTPLGLAGHWTVQPHPGPAWPVHLTASRTLHVPGTAPYYDLCERRATPTGRRGDAPTAYGRTRAPVAPDR